MTQPKKVTSPTNGDRVTNRDLLVAVQGVHTRIDDVNRRVDESLDGQRTLSGSMTKLHEAMCELRETTNERLHEMEADIILLKRPWQLMRGGWRKAVALAATTSALTGLVMKFGVPIHWPF